MSTVALSETDVRLFQSLSNPETVDVTKPMPNALARAAAAPPRPPQAEKNAAALPARIEENDQSAHDSDSSRSPSPRSPPRPAVAPPTPFERALSQYGGGTDARSVASSLRDEAASGTHWQPEAPPEPQRFRAPPAPPYRAAPAPPPQAPPFFQQQQQRPSAARGRESDDVMLEKQSILLDLDRLKLRGITLTREYTLNDNIDDMAFELKRHLAHQEEDSSVNMMRDFMRIACTGIELGNSKLGPFLELDGWSAEVCADIHKYDSALSKLYRKHWRRSASSPETEILMGILGSVGLFHFKKKFARGFEDTGGGRGGGGGGAGGGGGLGGLGGLMQLVSGLGGGNATTARPPKQAAPRRSYAESSSDEEAPGDT